MRILAIPGSINMVFWSMLQIFRHQEGQVDRAGSHGIALAGNRLDFEPYLVTWVTFLGRLFWTKIGSPCQTGIPVGTEGTLSL